MFTIDVLGMSLERHPPDIKLGRLQDVLGAFHQKCKSIQQLVFKTQIW